MNDRGQYGKPRVGQVPQHAATVYVERESSSTGAWILGALAVGGAVLWARHQSRQVEQLYRTSGLPYQSFTGSLREHAKSLPSRAQQTFRGVTARVRPAKTPAIPALPVRSMPTGMTNE
jgi:hypothetical protein